MTREEDTGRQILEDALEDMRQEQMRRIMCRISPELEPAISASRCQAGAADGLIREEMDRIERDARLVAYSYACGKLDLWDTNPGLYRRLLAILERNDRLVNESIGRMNMLMRCHTESEELRREMEGLRHRLCVMSVQGEVSLTLPVFRSRRWNTAKKGEAPNFRLRHTWRITSDAPPYRLFRLSERRKED